MRRTTLGSVARMGRWFGYLAFAAVVVVSVTAGFNFGARYYFWLFAAAAPLALSIALRRVEREAAMRAQVAQHWSSAPPARAPLEYRSRPAYRELFAGERAIDEKTWSDLGLDALFERIDSCFSVEGRNELYLLLASCLRPVQELDRQERLVERIRRDEPLRLELLSRLAPLDNLADHDPLPLFASSDALPRSGPTLLFVVMSLAALASPLAAIFAGPVVGFFCIAGMVTANMWIYYGRSKAITAQLPLLRGLYRLVRQASSIAAARTEDDAFDAESIRSAASSTGPLRRALVSVMTGAAGSGTASADIVETLVLYLKVLFLVDLIAYSRLAKLIERHRDSIRALYRWVGRLDALQAVASFLERTPGLCRARLDGHAGIVARGIVHPLVADAVPNDLDLRLPGAIVTGTNMAGKSTLLRAIGVNALLAQTIGHCFADSYEAGRFHVMSSIDKRDDLSQGKSFYYAEAERIYRMTRQVKAGESVLLLIDELLAGTNSLERESASVAILTFLAENGALTVAATHDVTVARRVAALYDPLYLTDHASDTGLSFDYRLRAGIVATRNAIRLLSIIGYPKDIIDRALEGST